MNSNKHTITNPLFDQLLKKLLPTKAPYIHVQELLEQTDDIIFLDTREREEFDVSHLKNALHVGYKKFDINNLPSLPDKKIVVYCSIGWRSGHIAQQLLEAGFKNIYNLYGGIFEWCNVQLPVYNNSGQINQVHAYSPIWKIWLRKGIKIIV